MEVVVTDVTDDAQVQHAVATALARFGRLDVCAHVAGVSAFSPHTDTTVAVFAQVVDTNVVGAANVARAALTVFRAQRAGTLVMVGSILGRIAVPGAGAYVASKWALRGLVRVLQQENRDMPGVRVTSVAPGSVRTAIFARTVGGGGFSQRAPAPSTSPRTVARAIRAAAQRAPRERDVDAFGGLGNKVAAAVFRFAPDVFDLVVGPLMRAVSPAPAPPKLGRTAQGGGERQ